MTIEKSFSTKNYSVEANYLALENLVEKNPELWEDKYLLGTGAQLIRLIAAGQSANGVRTLQALYESLLGYMQRKDSILGFSETMGYNAFRGSNDELTIVATASETISIPARSVIGKVQGVDLICSNALVASEGQTFTFKAKIGNLKTESRQIVDAEYKFIRFLSKDISDDVVLLIDDVLTEYKTAFKDVYSATDDSTAYVMMTNAYGSVDVFIVDRSGWTDTDVSKVYTISYIEYTDLDYVESDIVFDYGDIQKVTLTSAGEQPQSVENLRVSIPYFRDTQREVLANRDPIKVLQLLMPSVESTAGTNLNTVHSLLTYKYADYHLVPDAQLKTLESQLAPTYYFGFCPSNIMQPIQYRTNLDIEIVVFSTLANEISIIDYLNSILTSYEKLPEASSIGQSSFDDFDTDTSYTANINFDDIESELNKMKDIAGEDVIKTAYVSVHSIPMATNTRVFLGNVIEEDSTLYQVKKFKYQTSTIPASFTWLDEHGDVDANGKYAICGDVLLEKWRLIYGYKTLTANTWYTPDTIVGISDTEIFRVHPYYALPTIQPAWNTEIGGLTYSGDLVWQTIKYVVGTPYTSGDLAIKGMIVTPSGSDVSYQLIGFTKTLSTILGSDVVTTELGTKDEVRSISNIWQSYTILSVNSEDLNIHA